MKNDYDFSRSLPNPYVDKLRKEVVIPVDIDTIDYFQKLEDQTGIPYQNLINLYLSDCVSSGRTPSVVWTGVKSERKVLQ